MGAVRKYPPVKLIAAVTLSDQSLWPSLQERLERLFSPVEHASPWYQFHHTDYYLAEMGEALRKRMVAFQDLVLAEQLPDFKLATNSLEQEYSRENRRRANIDPGYIAAPRLVLATTKDFSHRLYLGKGIFGDLHLKYIDGKFQPQDWTYPDYREEMVLSFFLEVRRNYMEQLASITW